MAKKDEFKLTNLPIEAQDKSITKDDFKLVAKDEKIYDKKFNTKPTTFFKDCMKRFAKNKSSVVAAVILGVLLLMSFIVPLFGPEGSVHAVNVNHDDIKYLEPKLFSKGNFWNGIRTYEDVPVDIKTGLPDKDSFEETAISELVPGKERYIDTPHEFGKDGYINFAAYQKNDEEKEYAINPVLPISNFNFATQQLSVKNFTVLDEAALLASNEETKTLPETYSSAKATLRFKFKVDGETDARYFDAVEFDTAQNLANVNVNALFNAFKSANGISTSKVYDLFPQIVIKAEAGKNVAALIKSLVLESDDEQIQKQLAQISFTSGNEALVRQPLIEKETNPGYWVNNGSTIYCGMSAYLVKAVTASFKYDVYSAKLGLIEETISRTDVEKYIDNGWITSNILSSFIKVYDPATNSYHADPDLFKCEIIDDKACPLAKKIKAENVSYDENGFLKGAKVEFYKYKKLYKLNKMPVFLMGTDKTGRDMFVNVFQGLRTSLLLGIGTTIVCFIFGLIWGSISGYFGGTVDLLMERFTDILSGVPWIVVMTLVILKAGKSTFGVFALALCLTGWIGTAATTRTQFYRFRGREYVLASRTLGASHGRLIAKHILPNAMGTIITSAVLMVPSVIFSEATLSFLGLAHLGNSDTGLSSLGVILSDNQSELLTHPYLLIFPSVVIALLMISFNLAGNGLRDAVNPSLKGEGE